MLVAFFEYMDAINAFMAKGGPILTIIALTTFVMWILIFERIMYYKGGLATDVLPM